MSEKTVIKCDGCEKTDINYTGNCEGWFLQLSNQSCAPWFMKEGLGGGVVTAMAMSPPIAGTRHFCGVPCLAKWLSEQSTNALEDFDKMMKGRAWLAERNTPPRP